MPTLIDSKVLGEILESEKKYKKKLETLIVFLNGPVFGDLLTDLKEQLEHLKTSSNRHSAPISQNKFSRKLIRDISVQLSAFLPGY